MDIFVRVNPENPRVPKIVGFDTELMNVDPSANDSGAFACRALLREVDGVPANNGVLCEQDSGRLFLPGNGASVYIDLDHLELAGPECRSAWDYAAAFHGMLGIARNAAKRANEGRHAAIRVHANNADGHGQSWGSHLSVMTSSAAWTRVFKTRKIYQLWLASAQASSMIVTGAGKVGADNGCPHRDYQISQRADFFECLSSIDTTIKRPLVNTRDETLAGNGLARIHCIFHDTTLCHTSLILKAGLMQVFLAMIEAGAVDLRLCFVNPLETTHAFSGDLLFRHKADLLDGSRVTAIEHQRLLHEAAYSLLDAEAADHIPDLGDLLNLWKRVLDAFAQNDLGFLTRNIDWVAKLSLIRSAASSRSLGWTEMPVKVLDHAWSDLENGLYFALERAGAVDRHFDDDAIRRAAGDAPADTRAYPRSRLIRALAGHDGLAIDWHQVRLSGGRGKRAIVRLPDPGAGRDAYGDLDGLDELELMQNLGVEIEREAWRWNAAYPPEAPLAYDENHE